MTTDLFIKPELFFQKVAQAGKVGDQAEMWPQEVTDFFYQEHPYLADAEVEPIFKETNDERGYAVGVIVARTKPPVAAKDVEQQSVTKEIKFPFVIKDKELSTFDVVIVGETFHPATEKNIMAAVQRPELFDVVKTMPGDVSLVNQLYPPYRSRYGFGTSFEGGAGGKFASVKDIMKISVLDQILPFLSKADMDRMEGELQKDESLRKVALQHKPLHPSLAKLASVHDVTLEDMVEARRRVIQPDVIQFSKVGREVRVRRANSQMYAPWDETLTMKEAAENIPTELRNRLMADGGATISADPVVRESFDESVAVRIKAAGMYRIKCSDPKKVGREKVARVFTSVVDFDMTTMPSHLAIFHDGDWSLQGDIAGIPTPDEAAPDFVKDGHAKVRDYQPADPEHVSSQARDGGRLASRAGMPKLGMVTFVGDGVVTLPVNLRSVRRTEDGVTLFGTSAMEEPIELIPTDDITKISKIGPHSYAIPTDLKVIHLGQPVSCAADPSAYVKVASAERLQIISDGQVYSFRGNHSLGKLGAAQTEFLNQEDAMFLAASLGVEPGYAEKMLKQSERAGAVSIEGVRPIVPEAEKISEAMAKVQPIIDKLSTMRVLLLKEAAILPGEDTVDKVLSLNFITPENVSVFTKNVPVFQATATELAKLLIGVRIGLEGVPEAAVQRSMQSIQGVIEALEELQYGQPSK